MASKLSFYLLWLILYQHEPTFVVIWQLIFTCSEVLCYSVSIVKPESIDFAIKQVYELKRGLDSQESEFMIIKFIRIFFLLNFRSDKNRNIFNQVPSSELDNSGKKKVNMFIGMILEMLFIIFFFIPFLSARYFIQTEMRG